MQSMALKNGWRLREQLRRSHSHLSHIFRLESVRDILNLEPVLDSIWTGFVVLISVFPTGGPEQ